MLKEVNHSLRCKNLGQHKDAEPRKVLGIVLHDTAGSGTHNDTLYLANDTEHRGVSVDFTVEMNGQVYQLNPNLNKYWTNHAGRATSWPAKHIAGRSINEHCIGIEIVQKVKPLPWPAEQVIAVAELCFFLCNTFGLAKTDITTHKKLITDGSRSDPRDWPWELFWTYFNQSAQPDTNNELKAKIHHKTVKGDTLYSLAIKYSTTIEKIKELNNLESNTLPVDFDLLVKE